MKRPTRPTRTQRRLTGCPIDFALEAFGDRWTLLVVRDILVYGKRHFREFLASGEGIATNILAARLRKLEKWGIVERRTDPENRRQVIYGLAPKGLELAPVLVEIAIWSANHDPHTKVNKGYIQRARQDREATARETIADFLRQYRARESAKT